MRTQPPKVWVVVRLHTIQLAKRFKVGMKVIAELCVRADSAAHMRRDVLLQVTHMHRVRAQRTPDHVIAAVTHSHVQPIQAVNTEVDVCVAWQVNIFVTAH